MSRRIAPVRSRTVLAGLRKAHQPTAVLAGIVAVLAIVALAPYGMRGIAELPGMDWARLSNVGQTYGAVSALLSVVALVGVALSVMLQARESLANRRQMARNFHHELSQMAMSDPVYMQCWGTGREPLPYEARRRYFYVNLIIAYWEMLWDLGDLGEAEVRRLAAEQLFTSEAARDFWRDWGQEWMALTEAQSRSRRGRFVRIMDEEYRRGVGSGPPVHLIAPMTAGSGADSRSRFRDGSMIAFGLAAGSSLAVYLCLQGRRGRP